MAPLGMRSGSPFTTDTISWIASFRPWCWIPTKTNGKVLKTNEFMGILSEYGWFWLASLACFICYGYIVIRWWRRADGDSELIKQAVVMVWYPIGVRFSILLMWGSHKELTESNDGALQRTLSRSSHNLLLACSSCNAISEESPCHPTVGQFLQVYCSLRQAG